jgi:hypothetical protein
MSVLMTASRPPVDTERRANEAVVFGGPGTRELRLLRWTPRPNVAGMALGFLDVDTSSGLQIRNIRFGVGPKGEHYILPPAEQQRDRDEIAALRTGHPSLLAGEVGR